MGTWKTYSIDDGLPSLRIEHIAEDHEGYIWFATRDNGVSCFDGDAFQSLPRNREILHYYANGAFQSVQVDRVIGNPPP